MEEIEPSTLEYASATQAVPLELLSTAQRLLGLAIVSGLCVAACFSPIVFGEYGGTFVHVSVFAATIAQAIYTGLAIRRLAGTSNTQLGMECVALFGLVVFCIAPVLSSNWDNEDRMFGVLSVAFFCLSATTARHVILYRMLARHSRFFGATRMARGLIALGWFKTFYEGLWLTLCFLAALAAGPMKMRSNILGGGESVAIVCAFGALFGCVGFGGVWVWMIVTHAFFVGTVNRARKGDSAFPVILPTSPALPPNRHVEVLDH